MTTAKEKPTTRRDRTRADVERERAKKARRIRGAAPTPNKIGPPDRGGSR